MYGLCFVLLFIHLVVVNQRKSFSTHKLQTSEKIYSKRTDAMVAVVKVVSLNFRFSLHAFTGKPICIYGSNSPFCMSLPESKI